MTSASLITKWRYRLIPDHLIGEVLGKPWIDNVIPVMALAVVLLLFGIATPEFFRVASLSDLGRELGEYLFIAIGLAIVMIAGGIDLSIGSNFALSNIFFLALVYKLQIPVAVAVPLAMAFGALIGLVNGLLIGYLRLRAFLTTLVMLIILRAVVDLLMLHYVVDLLSSTQVSGMALWDFLGDGSILHVPASFIVAACVAVAAHFLLTRSRLGWHILAVGGARRAAFNAGIHVRRTVCLTYVFSGALTALAAAFYGARLNTAGDTTGIGMEFVVITGTVVGGISLGGGRGSILRAVLGTIIVLCINSGMLRLGLASGGSSMMLGAILLIAVVFDIRWTKNRHKVLARAYISPTYVAPPSALGTSMDAGTPYAVNDALRDIGAIGLNEIEGPDDIILDDADNLYCGNRQGDVVRFFPPDYKRWEVFAHIGGHPLGLAFDKDGNLLACVAGIGLCKITKEREVITLSSQTARSPLSIVDDSRIRLANDLDIAPDGRIFYSDSTVRYELSEWLSEALEMRPNGRILCYDPRDGKTRTVLSKLLFPNGICVMHDGVSLLFSSTWGAGIYRYWFDGPKRGKKELFIGELPGYPDTIHRASDGTYWCALVGMRTPAFDLALGMPQMRRRMINDVAPDNWLFPNTNSGCVLKFDGAGKILQSLWDVAGETHSNITSVREHKGRLFIGGRRNNRIGVCSISGADQAWTTYQSYWGRLS